MTPEQREAALRLALRESFSLGQTYWQQVDSESYSQKAKSEVTAKRFADLADETCAALLRELAAEPEPAPGYCKHCKQYTIEQPLPAEPDEDAQYRCGGPGCDGNCCQPVQEPEQEAEGWKMVARERGWLEPRQQAEPVQPAADAPTMVLGEINARLGFIVTEAFMTTLGFTRQVRIGKGVHYLASDWPAIKLALCRYIEALP